MVRFLVASLKRELFYAKQSHLQRRNLISGTINLALLFSPPSLLLKFGPFSKLTRFSYKSSLGLRDVTRLIFSP